LSNILYKNQAEVIDSGNPYGLHQDFVGGSNLFQLLVKCAVGWPLAHLTNSLDKPMSESFDKQPTSNLRATYAFR